MLSKLRADSQIFIVNSSKGEYIIAIVDKKIWHIRSKEGLMLLEILENSSRMERKKVRKFSLSEFLRFSSTDPILSKIDWIKFFKIKKPTFNST